MLNFTKIFFNLSASAFKISKNFNFKDKKSGLILLKFLTLNSYFHQ